MVGIAQLVERLVVVQEVAGSSPVTHPNSIEADCVSRPNTLVSVMHMPAEEFERLVEDELDALPDDMVDGLENVAFLVEDRPADGSLNLLGLYDGVDLTRRGQYGFGEMPDRITLYREPLLAVSRDLQSLRDQVHVTLVHEIAHFYGIDDDELHDLGWG
jgi:predicted Zn-dependent protease with MMP-like domain